MERSRSSVSFVVFDLGEVLSQSPPHLQTLALLIGADGASFERAYWSHRDAYDLGGSDEDYWNKVATEVNRPMTRAQAEQLSTEDLGAWVTLHPDSIGLLEDLAKRRIGLGLLSNAPLKLAEIVRSQPWAELFDVLVFSSDIGICKPDRRVYDLTAVAAGAAPSEIFFFDDRAVNQVGAQEAGWMAHLWTGHADARRILAQLGVI